MNNSRRCKPEDVVAVILAAGRGTRMGGLTERLPKPLVPVLGRPALHWVMDGLVGSGISKFVIVTGYLSDLVRDSVFAYGLQNGTAVEFVHQDEQKGTGHAMGLTRGLVGEAPVLLSYADIMTAPENYSAMALSFCERDCVLTAAVRDVGDPYRAAAVYVDDRWSIKKIIEKPPIGTSTTPWSHAGMYCFSNDIYHYIDRITPSPRGELEITDAVQMILDAGLDCQAVELVGYWKDLATPQDIVLAEEMMRPSAESAL